MSQEVVDFKTLLKVIYIHFGTLFLRTFGIQLPTLPDLTQHKYIQNCK